MHELLERNYNDIEPFPKLVDAKVIPNNARILGKKALQETTQ